MGKSVKLGIAMALVLPLLAGCAPAAPQIQTTPAPAVPANEAPAISSLPVAPTSVATTNSTAQAAPATLAAAPATAPAAPEGVAVGNTAIDFQLQTLNGQTISLKGLRGKPVLLNFWATWCPPCIGEMPSIQLVNYEHQGKDVVIMTVDVLGSRPTETPATLADFMKKNEYTFPVLLDTDGKITKKYLILSIPTTFLIDKDGIIQYKQLGPFRDKDAIETVLKKFIP